MSPTPINGGYIDGDDLIVPECRICSDRHIHSSEDVEVGYLIERVAHCSIEKGEETARYRIFVVPEEELE